MTELENSARNRIPEVSPPETFEAWLEYGYRRGWCGPPVCDMHDGLPYSQEEADRWDSGDEPCIHILRLYASPEDKAQVESHHSPSVWRASNRGLRAT